MHETLRLKCAKSCPQENLLRRSALGKSGGGLGWNTVETSKKQNFFVSPRKIHSVFFWESGTRLTFDGSGCRITNLTGPGEGDDLAKANRGNSDGCRQCRNLQTRAKHRRDRGHG